MKKNILEFLIPIFVSAVFALGSFFPVFDTFENRLYDLLLHLKKPIEENESILLLDIDDVAIAKVGVFPWSRDIMANGLILMKEFEARYAVFDIEYVDPSPRGINPDVMNEEIPETLREEFDALKGYITDLFGALVSGSIKIEDAGDYIEQLASMTDDAKDILQQKIRSIERDNDVFLGQAARFFENAFFTVSMQLLPEENVAEELKQFAYDKATIEDIEVYEGYPHIFEDVRPTLKIVLEGGKGAGFVNVVIDDDGVRRRLELINGYKDRFFPQLGFSGLYDWLGKPKIVVKKGSLTLEQATFPDGTVKDLTVPLTEDARLLINWSSKKFIDSFRHLSYWNLVSHDRLMERLVYNLKYMGDRGYMNYYQGEAGLLDVFHFAESVKREVLEGGDTAAIADYREMRKVFLDEVGKFLADDTQRAILADIETVVASADVAEETKTAYRDVGDKVPGEFDATREIYNELLIVRAKLQEHLPGSYCIIGWTGQSTTDIGVNPFEGEYMNVGTHASVANTILNGVFLDDLPWWYSAIAGLLLALLMTFVIRGLEPLPSIIVGLTLVLLLTAGGVAFFVFTGIYLRLMAPLLSVFITFLAFTVIKFLRTAQEKSFLRNAFSHYLSPDVINDLLDDPDKLNLGGEKKNLTAIFTDVRGFSSISEVLDPTDLVRLLNAYLSEMSNIILDLRGTIDKYEGDAIIAFYGAPVEFEDHARCALLSAVRMRKAEIELNKTFLDSKLSPSPLLTRIGINTGEMVVGNMGTIQKMDYTIMGNSVNLAARLEGVNKQYGTWTLISEQTKEAGGDEFTFRQMDRVRVVGISEPVRLYELVDEKSQAEPSTVEAIELFHEGQGYFENQDWDKALSSFNKVLEIIPGDGPAETFIKRCRQYKRKPPPDTWDGVFNLTAK